MEDRKEEVYLQLLLRKGSNYWSANIELAVEQFLHTISSSGFNAGNVSTGLMQATPGEIKSFKSSAERIALIVTVANAPAPLKYWFLS